MNAPIMLQAGVRVESFTLQNGLIFTFSKYGRVVVLSILGEASSSIAKNTTLLDLPNWLHATSQVKFKDTDTDTVFTISSTAHTLKNGAVIDSGAAPRGTVTYISAE